MAAAPHASNTTMKTAVITATTPRELLIGNVTCFITWLFMTHHRLRVNDKRVWYAHNSRNPRNQKKILILRTHGQSSGIRPAGPNGGKGYEGRIYASI